MTFLLVETAVIPIVGSLVTAGYVDQLVTNVPADAAAPVVAAREDSDVLVNEQALAGLVQAARAIPGGDQAVEQLLLISREALAGAVQQGFIFALIASTLAIAATFLMPNVRFDEKPGIPPVPEAAPAGGSAAATLSTSSTATNNDAEAEDAPVSTTERW